MDRAGLAQLILSVMEGGVMQARTHRSIEPYDASVRQLRAYMDALLARSDFADPSAVPNSKVEIDQ